MLHSKWDTINCVSYGHAFLINENCNSSGLYIKLAKRPRNKNREQPLAVSECECMCVSVCNSLKRLGSEQRRTRMQELPLCLLNVFCVLGLSFCVLCPVWVATLMTQEVAKNL